MKVKDLRSEVSRHKRRCEELTKLLRQSQEKNVEVCFISAALDRKLLCHVLRSSFFEYLSLFRKGLKIPSSAGGANVVGVQQKHQAYGGASSRR